MRKSMTGGGDRPFYFRYHVRGYEMCKDVFMAVHAVGSHVMKRLQKGKQRSRSTGTTWLDWENTRALGHFSRHRAGCSAVYLVIIMLTCTVYLNLQRSEVVLRTLQYTYQHPRTRSLHTTSTPRPSHSIRLFITVHFATFGGDRQHISK